MNTLYRKTLCALIVAAWLAAAPADAATRQMERLNRGVTAVKVASGVLVTWRIPATEWSNTSYNVYRGGTKLNASPIAGNSNYLDTGGTTSSTYTVRPVTNGTEGTASPAAAVWPDFYKAHAESPHQLPHRRRFDRRSRRRR